MWYICVITFLCYTSCVTSEFHIGLNFIRVQLKLGLSKLDVSMVEEKSIEQPLDHYDQHETRKLKMRYFQNLDNWKPSGPIYVFIGGEGGLDNGWISNDRRALISQLATETNGAMFSIEHRYYGSSVPDIPKYDKIQYYKYLSSQQALADVANLIKRLKSDPKYLKSKVVVVGASYSGNLAAWMREQYPHLVDAAIAISAPILAQKDFREYLEVVRYAFATYGPENCVNQIEKTFKTYEELLKTPEGREKLKSILNIPPYVDLTVLRNEQDLFANLYGPMMKAAQFNQKPTIKEVCDDYKFPMNNLNLTSVHTSYIRSGDELELWNQQAEDAWTYQYCNEFGYLMTTSSEKQPFVHWNPLEYRLESCRGFTKGDIEKTIDDGVANTNWMYGGRTPKVNKVVFTHGDMDPWKVLGVQQDLSPDAPMIMVHGTAHCGILSYADDEPKEMTEKRKYVKDLIKKWIS